MRPNVIAYPILGLAALLHYLTLLRFPPPFIDEINCASVAWALIRTGRVWGPLQAGVLEKFDGYWTFSPLLGTWIQSLGIRAFGLNLEAIRLISLIFGLILLSEVYLLARHLISEWQAVTALVLTAFSTAFFTSAHLGRQDVIVAALGFGAVTLSAARPRPLGLLTGFLTGALVGLAFEIHPNGAVFGLPILVFGFLDRRWEWFRSGGFLGFALGAAGGLALWAWLHVVRYPRAFFGITNLAFAGSKTFPFLTLSPGVWLRSTLDADLLLVLTNDFKTPVLAAAIVWAIHRRSPGTRKVLALFLSLLVGFILIVPYKPAFYAILIDPAADLLLASYLGSLVQRVRAQTRPLTSRAWVVRLAVVWLVIASFTLRVFFASHDPMPDYQATVARLQSVIPRGSVILGDETFWLAFPSQPFYAWQEITYFERYHPGSTLEDVRQAYHPDYLIIGPNMSMFIADQTVRAPAWEQILVIDRSELNHFLSKHADLVAEIRTETFGDVRAYRLH